MKILKISMCLFSLAVVLQANPIHPIHQKYHDIYEKLNPTEKLKIENQALLRYEFESHIFVTDDCQRVFINKRDNIYADINKSNRLLKICYQYEKIWNQKNPNNKFYFKFDK